MKHYTNKNTNEVFGYESIEDAQAFNDDFENLVEMTDEQFIQFRDHRPRGGKWTAEGWVIDEALLAQEEAEEKQRKIQSLHDDLETLERDISRLERIRDRNEDEESKLQQLYDESTQLYRDIQAIEND